MEVSAEPTAIVTLQYVCVHIHLCLDSLNTHSDMCQYSRTKESCTPIPGGRVLSEGAPALHPCPGEELVFMHPDVTNNSHKSPRAHTLAPRLRFRDPEAEIKQLSCWRSAASGRDALPCCSEHLPAHHRVQTEETKPLSPAPLTSAVGTNFNSSSCPQPCSVKQ